MHFSKERRPLTGMSNATLNFSRILERVGLQSGLQKSVRAM